MKFLLDASKDDSASLIGVEVEATDEGKVSNLSSSLKSFFILITTRNNNPVNSNK
jgi:hypothetical protein